MQFVIQVILVNKYFYERIPLTVIVVRQSVITGALPAIFLHNLSPLNHHCDPLLS